MSSAVDSSGTSYFLKKVNENNPVVFIHGVGLNKEIWIPQINFFKKLYHSYIRFAWAWRNAFEEI